MEPGGVLLELRSGATVAGTCHTRMRHGDAITAALYNLRDGVEFDVAVDGQSIVVQGQEATFPLGMTCAVLPNTRQVLVRVQDGYCFVTVALQFIDPEWYSLLTRNATEQWYANVLWGDLSRRGQIAGDLLQQFYQQFDYSVFITPMLGTGARPTVPLHEYVLRRECNPVRATMPEQWQTVTFRYNTTWLRLVPDMPTRVFRLLWPEGMPMQLPAEYLTTVSLSWQCPARPLPLSKLACRALRASASLDMPALTRAVAEVVQPVTPRDADFVTWAANLCQETERSMAETHSGALELSF